MSLEASAKWEQFLLLLFGIVLGVGFLFAVRLKPDPTRRILSWISRGRLRLPSNFQSPASARGGCAFGADENFGGDRRHRYKASISKTVLLLVVLCALLLGIVRYRLAIPNSGEGSVAVLIGRAVTVEGIVADETRRSSMTQSLVLDDLLVDGEKTRQKILARVPLYPEFSYGDRVRLDCTLEAPRPFSAKGGSASGGQGFRYDRYLAKEGVLAICQSYVEPFSLGHVDTGLRGRLLSVKSGILERIRLTFHEPYAALLEGLLLGEKNLPDGIEEDFRRAGLSHIVAASGQNVALVTDVLFGLLIYVGFRRRGASGLLLFAIVLYVLLAGADAAIVRAGIMGSIIVFAKAVGRVPSAINILLFALALMLLHNPLLLRDDVGFQLSFAATAGLVVLQPRLSRFFAFLPRALGLRSAVATSVAAIAATLPIMVLSFGQVSLVAPIANMIVLPLIPFVMIVGAVILLVSAFFQPFALYLAAPVAGGLKVMLGSAHLLSSLPFAAADFAQATWIKILFFIAALFLLRWLLSFSLVRVPASERLSPRYFVVVGLLLLLPMLPDLLPRQDFRAYFFSVGQGDATLFEFEGLPRGSAKGGALRGERWLIDGGPDNAVLVKLGQTLPWYSRRIDVLVPTHADADHITGLIEVSRRYDIGHVYISADDTSRKMQILQELWRSVPVELIARGDDLSVGDVSIEVFGPPPGFVSDDRNDLSVVLLIEREGRKFLLTGDASQDREREFVSGLDHIDVYKAGHHGSYTSTSYELVQKTKPSIVVVSAGKENRYGHPHGVVLRRLEDVGSEILRTDVDGDIEVGVMKGGHMEVKTGRFWY